VSAEKKFKQDLVRQIDSRKDNTGAMCPKCGKGTLQEQSVNDDRDGRLTCDRCFVRTPRWTILPYARIPNNR
jgi:hypothetical protein